MTEQRRPTLDWRWCVALALVALVGHAGVLSAGLVYDDNVLVGMNPFLRDGANLGALFSPWQDRVHLGYFASEELSWRPVATAVHLVEFQLFGLGGTTDADVLAAAPWLHGVSWLLHAVVTVLLFGLLTALRLPRHAAFLGAALFALHPVQVEAVMLVSFREDLLATGFTIGACWLAALGPPSWRRAAAMGALAFLACGSKESALVLPGLLAVVAWAAAARQRLAAPDTERPGVRAWIPAAACVGGAVLLFAVLRFVVLANPAEAELEPVAAGLFGLLAADLWIIGEYAWVVAMPTTLLIDRGVPAPAPWSGVVPGVILVVGWAVSGWRARRTMPGLSGGIAFMGLAILPVMNLVPVSIPIAERFLYLPFIGVAWFVAEGVASVAPRMGLEHPKFKQWAGVAGVLALLCVARNYRRAGDFADDPTLWAATYRAAPDSARANANHGLMERHRAEQLLASGRMQEGEALLDAVVVLHERAVELMPGERGNRQKLAGSYALRAQLRRDRGRAGEAAKDLDAAVAQVRQVLVEEPERSVAWALLAELLHRRGGTGDAAESLTCHRRVMELEPLQLEPRKNYATKLFQSGAKREALAVIEATPEAQRAHPYWYSTKAWMQEQLGDRLGARQTLEAGLSVFPGERHLMQRHLALSQGSAGPR